jgi:hypothetical protein
VVPDLCPRSLADAFERRRAAHQDQPEIDMSADKDRGIRRQKQKRAKDRKKQLRQQHAPTPAPTDTAQRGAPASK